MLRRNLLAAPLLLAAAPAFAQWVPKQPIKILVGYAPGGTADIAARIAADTIQRQHGYPVIVDNKTGAGGFIALKQVAQAPPDGYTVGIGIMGQLAVGPVVPGSQIPLDLDKELVPICNLVGVPMALIVRMDAPFKTIPELVAYAKANPGQGDLRLDRPRLDQPARRGVPRGGSGRAEVDPRALSRRRAGDRRRGGGQRRPLLRQRVGDHEHGARRQGARAGARLQQADAARAGAAAAHQGHSGPRHQQLVRPGRPGRRCRPTSRRRWPSCFSMRWQIPRTRKRSTSRASIALGQGPEAFAAYIKQDRERWAKVVKQGNIKAE